MAVRETLEFDLRGALAQLNTLERQIDDLRRPVNLDVDVTGDAEREIRAIDDRLENIVSETQDVNRELGQMQNVAARSVDDFSSLARLMGVSEEHARDVATQIAQAERASARLDDEVGQVARALGLSERAASQLVTELRQADRAAKDIGNATGPSKLVGVFTGAAVAATAAAVGIGLGGRAAFSAIQQFAELEDSINAVNVVFGEAGAAVADFGETAAASAGLSQTAFNQAVVPIGSLLQNFGFDAREAADASVILVQRAADLASVMGGTVQEALLAVGAALRGEADPLERYGASISAARVEQFALAEGLAATKGEITDAVRLQARYGLILADTARVQGDFANTSGDLANAQRIAAAEASNLASSVGESLAPAFEAILAQAPPIIDFFASLNPALAEAAGNSTAAASGLTTFVTSAVLGLGQVGDTLGILGDFGQIGIGFFEDLGDAIRFADRDFSHMGDQIDQFTQRQANAFIRQAGLQIPRAIQAGIAPINAFGQAIAFLGQQDDNLETIQQGFERLSIQAGLTDPELQSVTRTLIDQADILGFTTDEVAFLVAELNDLNETLDDGGRANDDYSASIAKIGGTFRTTFGDTTQFTRFSTDTETAADAAGAALIELASIAAAQAERAANAFDLFADQPEKLTESFNAGVQALREAVQTQAQFDINLAILQSFGLDALAADFARIGVEGIDQLIEAVNLALTDLPAAIEADRLLQGFGAIGEEAFDFLVAQFVAAGIGPTEAAKIAKNIISPEVIAALDTAAVQVGNRTAVGTVTEFREALLEEAQLMDAAQIREAINDRVEESFTADDAAEYAALSTVTAWEVEAIRAAENLSGAELQARLGELFSGVIFDIDASQFRFPDSGAFQGTIGVGAVLTNTTSPATTPTNVTIYQNFTGPIQDVPTQLAQANQSTAAVATLFTRVQS